MNSGKKVTILDVRTPAEYHEGCVKGSVNIPLQELPNRISEIQNLPQPLVLCCASGMRSAKATQFLMQQGIQCSNGGSWISLMNVNI